jgi:serine/threonine protein phosphatase PrpC
MKIRVLYDQGSTHIPEDGIIFYPPYYYGVSDGISGIYLPHEGPKLFSGETGGQFASRAISCAFGSTLAEESLENILRRANTTIRKLIGTNGLSLQASELLPSAAFAVASVTKKSINILQGGDSLAVWLMKDGTIGGTPNRVFNYEDELLSTIAVLMEKHKKDRQKMWEEFRPILAGKRRSNINTIQGGFALINGQPEVENFWQKFVLRPEEIVLLILFSDGFVPFGWTREKKSLARKVIHIYQTGGLYSVLEETRVVAEKKKSSSHEDYAEATAIAIEF